MILVLKGIPASGKSTFARAWVSESPTTRVYSCKTAGKGQI